MGGEYFVVTFLEFYCIFSHTCFIQTDGVGPAVHNWTLARCAFSRGAKARSIRATGPVYQLRMQGMDVMSWVGRCTKFAYYEERNDILQEPVDVVLPKSSATVASTLSTGNSTQSTRRVVERWRTGSWPKKSWQCPTFKAAKYF